MTNKFIRWNCPNCETHNILPVVTDADAPPLRCAYCEYLYDPLDDTQPRAEGRVEEGADKPQPPDRSRHRWRETPT